MIFVIFVRIVSGLPKLDIFVTTKVHLSLCENVFVEVLSYRAQDKAGF